jgi:hypothetical protein
MGFEEYMKIGIADLTTRYGLKPLASQVGLARENHGKSLKHAQVNHINTL